MKKQQKARKTGQKGGNMGKERRKKKPARKKKRFTTFGDILTLEEVAAYLQLGRMTIYSYAQKGKIPAFKAGNKWRFSKRVIEAWIAKGGVIEK